MDRWRAKGRGVQDHSVLLRYYGSRPPYTALQLVCQPELFSEAHQILSSSPFAVTPSSSYRPHLRGFWWKAPEGQGCMHDRTSSSSIFHRVWACCRVRTEMLCLHSHKIMNSYLFLPLMGLNQWLNRHMLCLQSFFMANFMVNRSKSRIRRSLRSYKTLGGE